MKIFEILFFTPYLKQKSHILSKASGPTQALVL